MIRASTSTHRINTIFLSTIFLVFLAACNPYDERTFVGLKTEPAKARLGSAVFSAESCPVAEDEEAAPALLGVVAAFGAEFAISGLNKLIQEHKEGLTGQFVATGIATEDPISNGNCLIIARGLFGNVVDGFSSNGGLTKAELNKFGFADHPAFYLELAIQETDNSVILQPVYLGYAASSAKTRGSGQKHVSAVIAMSDTSLTESENIKEENAFAVFRHNFGRLEIGKAYIDKDGRKLLLGTAASLPKSDKFEVDTLNIAVLVTESEEPSIALRALSETFESKKGDLQSALEDLLKDVLGASEN